MCRGREKNCLCVEFMAAIWWNYRISLFNTVYCMCVLSSLLGALSVANVNANSAMSDDGKIWFAREKIR